MTSAFNTYLSSTRGYNYVMPHFRMHMARVYPGSPEPKPEVNAVKKANMVLATTFKHNFRIKTNYLNKLNTQTFCSQYRFHHRFFPRFCLLNS